jgi:phosphopantetheine adenylyltransferase
MKSFSQFINEDKNHAVVVWGRLNPPTIGHLKLLDKGAQVAKGSSYLIYVSQSTDPKKNPLDYNTKVKWIRKMFPRHARNVMLDKSVKTMFDLLTKVYDNGFTTLTLIAGSDRVAEYQALANKYNNVKARHGFYNFEGGVKVVSAGERDPDAEGASGMSASKMRAAAETNDYQMFQKGLPKGFTEGQQLFNELRKAMGLKESVSFRDHLQLKSVSEVREAFVQDKIFNKGDTVKIKKTSELADIVLKGANYVIVEKADSVKARFWLTDIEEAA